MVEAINNPILGEIWCGRWWQSCLHYDAQRPAPETGEMSPKVVFPPLGSFLFFSTDSLTLCAFDRQEL